MEQACVIQIFLKKNQHLNFKKVIIKILIFLCLLLLLLRFDTM